MEPRDGNGSGESKSPKKRRAPSARKRAPKPVQAAEQNGTAEREVQLQTAYDVKDIHRSLAGFSDDDLKQIPIIATGTHLEQGATYIDLAEARPSEVKVNAGVIARDGNYYVPKNRVPYTIWNRLIGEAKPGQERSGAEDRTSAGGGQRAGGSGQRTNAELGGTPGREADRTPADMAGDRAEDSDGGSFAAGARDGGSERQSDYKSWIDTRPEDRDAPREVL